MLQLSIVMPGILDGNAQSMAKRLREQFQQKESKSATPFSGGANAEDDKNDTRDAVQNSQLNMRSGGANAEDDKNDTQHAVLGWGRVLQQTVQIEQ